MEENKIPFIIDYRKDKFDLYDIITLDAFDEYINNPKNFDDIVFNLSAMFIMFNVKHNLKNDKLASEMWDRYEMFLNNHKNK